MHTPRTSRSVRGKLPRTTGRRPVPPGRLFRREGVDDFFEAPIAAHRIRNGISFNFPSLSVWRGWNAPNPNRCRVEFSFVAVVEELLPPWQPCRGSYT